MSKFVLWIAVNQLRGIEGEGGANAPVVVLTTSETATARVLAVLANATVTGGDVAAVLASLGEPCRHFLFRMKGNKSRDQRSG